MIKRLAQISSLIAGLSLSACVSILPEAKPADAVYRLSEISQSVVPNADAVVIRVDRAAAPQALAGQDIIVSPNERELSSALGARWVEPVPILVQTAMLSELAQRADMIGVEPVSGARSDLRMYVSIKSFEARFDNGPESPPMAIVHLDVTVSEAATRKLVGTFDVRKTQRADAVRVSAIVEAQDMANSAAVKDIADWLSSLVQQS